MTKNEFKELRRRRLLNMGTFIEVTQPGNSGLERGKQYKITGVSQFDSNDCWIEVIVMNLDLRVKIKPSQFKKAE